MQHLNTYFYNEKNERFASQEGVLPISVGMIIKVRDGNFTVTHTELNLDNHDPVNGEELGLQVFCKPY